MPANTYTTLQVRLISFCLPTFLAFVLGTPALAADDTAEEKPVYVSATKRAVDLKRPPVFSMSAVHSPDPRLEPLFFLDRFGSELKPRYRFEATTRDAWQTWHRDFRKAVTDAIGLERVPRTPLGIFPGPVEKKEGYTRYAYTIETSPGLFVPAFLLIPEGAKLPRPAVLCAHGHGIGMNSLVGLLEDGSERPFGEGYHHDMALQAVQAGFVTLVYDQFGFGRRRDFDFNKHFNLWNACEHPSKSAIHYGLSTTGIRIFDAMRMLDFMQSHPSVQGDKIAMVGISGGGLVTQFTAALDDRVKAACVSGHLNHFSTSILGLRHCIDNYTPGLSALGDNEDIACLIAPRPLLIESGTQDPIFPIEATHEAIAKLETSYKLLDKPSHLETDIFENGHEFSGAKTWTFFAKHLELKK